MPGGARITVLYARPAAIRSAEFGIGVRHRGSARMLLRPPLVTALLRIDSGHEAPIYDRVGALAVALR